MVRILHVLSNRLATGTSKQVELLCDGLRPHGFEHALVSLESDHDRITQMQFGSKVSFCRQSSPFDLTFLPRLRQLLHKLTPNLIHVWGDELRWPSSLFPLVSRSTPVVVAKRSFEDVQRTLPVVGRWLLRHVSRLVVNHPQLQRMLLNQGIADSRVVCVPNGVEPTTLEPTVCSLHRELDLSPSIRFVAVSGDLCAKKRTKDLIWAMDLLRVIHPNMHLLILGDGDQIDRLKEYDRQVNLDACVHFLGNRPDVRQVLSQCLCCWQASRDEGCSNAVLEAMAVGLPVIASDIPGHRVLVQQGVSGFLVPLGDCAEFARKTNGLIHNQPLAQQMAEAGRKRVQTEFSLEAMVCAYRALYDSLIEASRSAA